MVSKSGSTMEFGSVDWKLCSVKVTISPDFGLRVSVIVASSLSVHCSSSSEVGEAAVSARNKAVVIQERPMLFARRVADADGTAMLL